MSSAGGSSKANEALFEKPLIRADPEDVRLAMEKALQFCNSTLNTKIDYEQIEKDAAEEEKNLGESFMKQSFHLHEGDAAEDLFGPSHKNDKIFDAGCDHDHDHDHDHTLTFSDQPDDQKLPEQKAPLSAADKRRLSSLRRRASSNMSSFDPVAYDMFADSDPVLSQKFMEKKWRNEAKVRWSDTNFCKLAVSAYYSPAHSPSRPLALSPTRSQEIFDEAHGGRKKQTTFQHVVGSSDFENNFDNESHQTDITGEVKNPPQMRLARIDNATVIRHSLNIDGLYGGLNNVLTSNQNDLSKILENSSDRLETRQQIISLAAEAIAWKLKVAEEEVAAKEVEYLLKIKKNSINNGSSLNISDLLNVSHKQFQNSLPVKEPTPPPSDDDGVSDTS